MKKILIIEDDAIIAKAYGSKYASAGFETSIAEDGEKGLELIDTFKPDLVHLDLMVPKLNGVEIIQRVRKQPQTRTLPLALYTALQTPDGDALASRLAILSLSLGLAGLLVSEILSRAIARRLGRGTDR